MNLDDLELFRALDGSDMYEHIRSLPSQLLSGWQLGQALPLPASDGLQKIVVAGMGGSAIGADLAATYVAQSCRLPITVLREYTLPAWAQGPHTLVIASSHSGNTEETLSVFEQAHQAGSRLMVISRGGKLQQAALAAQVPFWQFEHAGAPRSAVGLSFSLLLAALHRLGFTENPLPELQTAVEDMHAQETNFLREVPVVSNPAKRLAGQLYNRLVVVLSSDYLAPVARRWKGQVSEVAKAWAQFETLPEADHNTLAGVLHPEDILSKSMVLFLTAPSDHPRNQLRARLTRRQMMKEGINTDVVHAAGSSPLSHIWTTLHAGDYVTYYLAMAYQEDPTPITAIEGLKQEMV